MFCDSAMLSGLRGPAVWLILALGVARAEAVIYASGALGCPEPDRLYTQAEVPGFRIVLALDGRYYDYRVGPGGAFRLCRRAL